MGDESARSAGGGSTSWTTAVIQMQLSRPRARFWPRDYWQAYGRLQKSDQGIGAVSNGLVRVFGHMMACVCQRGGRSQQTRDMVCRRRVPIGDRRPSIAHWPQTSRNGLKRESSPRRTPIILLWRSRRAVGRVRTAPGAPPTAAASPDGREARHRKSPWEGEGVNTEGEIRLCFYRQRKWSAPISRSGFTVQTCTLLQLTMI